MKIKSAALAIWIVFLYIGTALASDLGVTAEMLHADLGRTVREGVHDFVGRPPKIETLRTTVDKSGARRYIIGVGDFVTVYGDVDSGRGFIKNATVELQIPAAPGSVQLDRSAHLYGFFSTMIYTRFADSKEEAQAMKGFFVETLTSNRAEEIEAARSRRFKRIDVTIDLYLKEGDLLFKTKITPSK